MNSCWWKVHLTPFLTISHFFRAKSQFLIFFKALIKKSVISLYGREKNFRKLSARAKSRAGVYLDDITSWKHYLITLWIWRISFCPPIRPKIGTDFFTKYGTGQRDMKIMVIYWPNFSKVIQHWSYCRQNRSDMEKLHRILKNGYIWNHFSKKHVFETDYSFSKC